MLNYRCYSCSSIFDVSADRYRCDCGGLFVLDTHNPTFELNPSNWSMWRYKSLIPLLDDGAFVDSVSMGEGMTPLARDNTGAMLKLDFLNPTLSYKDRGSVVLLALAGALGVKEVAIDSSGNAGVSVAAYSKRMSIGAHVFVPEFTSQKKVKQLALFDAQVHQEGDRAFASLAVSRFLEQHPKVFYASHVYNPFFVHGVKTVVLEIFEQLGRRLPEEIVVPVGNGTLVLGACQAIMELKEALLLDGQPKVVAVQARGCAPIYKAFHNVIDGSDSYSTETLAEGIAISAPPRIKEIISALSACEGTVVAVSEDEILDAQLQLLKQGIDVEPTAAATYAGYLTRRGDARCARDTVVILTGAGLKSR